MRSVLYICPTLAPSLGITVTWLSPDLTEMMISSSHSSLVQLAASNSEAKKTRQRAFISLHELRSGPAECRPNR